MNFLVLKRYPHLYGLLPFICECGTELAIASEFKEPRFAGVTSEKCHKCDLPPSRIYTYISEEEMYAMADLIRGIQTKAKT